MHRRDALLAILGAAEGRPFSPVQLQKSAFLIDRNLPELFDGRSKFTFAAYDYGPFDRDVYVEATGLALKGLATVDRGASGYAEYRATDVGVDKGQQLLDSMNDKQRRYVQSVVKWVRSLGFAKLVKSIYEAYPEMRANSIFQG